MKLHKYNDIYVLTIYKKDTSTKFDLFVIDPFVEKERFTNTLDVVHNKIKYTLHTLSTPTLSDVQRIKENFINQLFNLEEETE